MNIEEATTLIHQYAEEYATYRLDLITYPSAIKAPPVNPVLKIVAPLLKQVEYWKLSFNKQRKATKWKH